MKKVIPISHWAEKNGIPRRTAYRMAEEGRIQTQELMIPVVGVEADLKVAGYPKKKKGKNRKGL